MMFARAMRSAVSSRLISRVLGRALFACIVISAVPDQAAYAQPSAAAQASVQAGIVVRPDTVTVGDPFTIVVRVRMPSQARVVWPTLDDTTAAISLRAPMVRRDGPSDVSGREEFAEFEVAAWDTGQVSTGWPAALVIIDDDTVPVALSDVGLVVRSVLSADTLQHVPKPAKPAFERDLAWWERWWPALLLLAALAVLAYVLWRRKQRPAARIADTPRLSAYEHAMHAFDRLDRLALTDAGEYGRATTLAMDVLRGYLSARLPATTRAQTSAELLAVVGDDTRVPLPRLIQLLVVSDAVKFARRRLTATETRAITSEARAVVDGIEAVEQTRREHAEALARAQEAALADSSADKRQPSGVA